MTALPAITDLAWLVHTHYGIRVGWFGEDGALVAVGHHEPKRVIAAFNRHVRVTADWTSLGSIRPLYDYADAVRDLRATWAIVLGPCSAPDFPFADEEERANHNARCERCYGARNGANWIEVGHKETDRRAYPVTIWRA